MKQILITFLLFVSISAYTQIDTLTKEDLAKELQFLKISIQTLQKENSSLITELRHLNTIVETTKKSIDSLSNKTQENSDNISQTANEFDNKIKETVVKNEDKITEVQDSLNKKHLYETIGLILAILIAISGIIIYFQLSKRQKKDKVETFNKLIATKENIKNESLSLDKQLLEIIEKQLKITDTLNINDHTFYKNSANELMRIRNYTNTLDPQSQDAIALKASIHRMLNYFKSSSYEIIDFTDQDYDERLPIKINDSTYDETLPKDKEVIVKTLKPLIKYKGEVIQEAEVDTKYN